jgi:hypothetical protein
MRAFVTVTSTIAGYSAATFNVPKVVNAFRTGYAARMQVPLGRVMLTNFADARRRLAAAAAAAAAPTEHEQRRRLASSVKFDIVVELASDAEATTYESKVVAASGADVTQDFADALTAAGFTPPTSLAVTKTAPTKQALTSAPTPAPPAPTPPRAKYTPSSVVKTLHGYMVAMPAGRGVGDTFDPAKTVEAAGTVLAVAVGGGVAVLLLWGLFLLCHKCCPYCKCCYRAKLWAERPCRAKAVVTLLFLLFAGLMCGSIKGRNSFHKAADVLVPALSGSAELFTEMEGGAGGMVAASTALDAGYAALTAGCVGTAAGVCAACPYPGAAAAGVTKVQWDAAARNALVGATGAGGAAGAMAPQLSTFKSKGAELLAMTKGQGATVSKIASSIGTDGKKYIDLGIAAVVAFGLAVALLGVLGTWCMSRRTGTGRCCSLSTLLLLAAQALGFLFLVLLVALVGIQASASAVFAEVCHYSALSLLVISRSSTYSLTHSLLYLFAHQVCYQPVPETAMLDVLTQSGRYNVLAPGAFDVPTLKYYMTCNGANELDAKLGTAAAQIAGLRPELDKTDKCDTSGLAGAVPAAAAAMTTVRYTVACPRISNLLLAFTRDAVCTHMVDGLYFLWTAQAAGGVFLALALVMMRLAQQGFHASAAHEKKKEQQTGNHPVYKGPSSVVKFGNFMKEHDEFAGAMSSVVAGGAPRRRRAVQDSVV